MEDLDIRELERILKEKKESRKKIKFSKLIVSIVIAMNILFTVAILYVFYNTGNEPITLVGAFFAFTTVELWSLSKIKRDEIEEDRIEEID